MFRVAERLSDLWQDVTGDTDRDRLGRLLALIAGSIYLAVNLRESFLVGGIAVGGNELYTAICRGHTKVLRRAPFATSFIARFALTAAVIVDLWRHLHAHLPVSAAFSAAADMIFGVALYVIMLPPRMPRRSVAPARLRVMRASALSTSA